MVIFDYCLTIKIHILLHQTALSIYFNMSRYILFAYCLLFCLSLSAQQKYTLSGTVTDASNGEKLLGVNLLIKGTQMGTSTNEYGFYSLTLGGVHSTSRVLRIQNHRRAPTPEGKPTP